MSFITAVFALLALAVVAACYVLTPPKHPCVPSIPFWVALLPLFKDVDQQDIFRQYMAEPLRTHGAVKMFFASQWNVLVHRPEYLAAIFKHEDAYQKSGNHKKIPGSVLASFLGDNVISAHGDVWRLYQGVMKPGLQRRFDANMLFTNALRLRDLLLLNGGAVQPVLQRYTIANTAQALLGADFHVSGNPLRGVYLTRRQTLDSDKAYLHRLQSSIKQAIFRPLFMSFPILDSICLPSREAARRHAAHFTDTLVGAVKGAEVHDADVLGQRLLAARAAGTLSERQFRDNVTVSFVAGQENPQLALTSALYLLAKHPVGYTMHAIHADACRIYSSVSTRRRWASTVSPSRMSCLTCRCSPPPCTRSCGCFRPSAS